MKKTILFTSIFVVIVFGTACGLLQGPAPQPQLSATDIPPQISPLSELPPTWTIAPTPSPSPTPVPSPTPLPTQDPENYQISLVMPAEEITYPDQFSNRAGWKLVEGKTARIFIPTSFETLDFAGIFMELMVGVMQAFAEGFVDFAEELGEEFGATPAAAQPTIEFSEPPDLDFIIAMEESTMAAIIMVSTERTQDTTTEDLLNEALSGSETDFQVYSRERYLDSPFQMERVILDVVDEDQGKGKQIIYVILGDQNGWNLVFTTPERLYEEYLPFFESVVDSFSPIQ